MVRRHVSLALCLFLVTGSSAGDGGEKGCAEDGKSFKVGERNDQAGQCQSKVCKGGDQWALSECEIRDVPRGWSKGPGDASKPFPECCAQLVPPLDIVPDVLDSLYWSEPLELTYHSVTVEPGAQLTPTTVKSPPQVHFPAQQDSYYVLCMTDPDAPSRQDPASREFLHWLVGNIPGDNVTAGETLSEYVGSGPPKGTGLHRYVFLVYRQPKKITFTEPRLTNTSTEGRRKFSIRKFSQKYDLGSPIAVNVFQAQWDDYVLVLHKQLGIN